jgi:sugar phosphate isomerase/epimerase
MKIGLLSSGLDNLNLSRKDVTKKLKSIGYDSYDYSLYGDWATPNKIFNQPREGWVNHFKEERKIIEGEGMNVNQTHAIFRSDFDPDNMYYFTPMVIDQLKKEIEATALLGAKYIVIHPINIANKWRNKELDFERNMTEFAKITPILKEFGVKNGVENMFTWDPESGRNCQTGCSTTEDMIRYLDGLNDRDAFCNCLDIGHMNIHQINPADTIRALGDRLEIIHAHDNNGNTDQHNPIGLGIIDWDDVVKALKEINYKGVFSLEVGFNKYVKFGEEAVWKMVEYAYESAKNLIEDL